MIKKRGRILNELHERIFDAYLTMALKEYVRRESISLDELFDSMEASARRNAEPTPGGRILPFRRSKSAGETLPEPPDPTP